MQSGDLKPDTNPPQARSGDLKPDTDTNTPQARSGDLKHNTNPPQAKARKSAVESLRAQFGESISRSGVLSPWYDWTAPQ